MVKDSMETVLNNTDKKIITCSILHFFSHEIIGTGSEGISRALSNAQHTPQIHSQAEGHVRETNRATYLADLTNRTWEFSR